MQVTLMGPGELGHWFLTDEHGNSFPLVTRHEDHPNAAEMFGWQRPEGIDDEAVIMNALNWLTDHTGEDFKAPDHVLAFFHQLNEDRQA